MLVFRKHRLVFIATPKTGSTAIEAVLGDQADLAVTKAPESAARRAVMRSHRSSVPR